MGPKNKTKNATEVKEWVLACMIKPKISVPCIITWRLDAQHSAIWVTTMHEMKLQAPRSNVKVFDGGLKFSRDALWIKADQKMKWGASDFKNVFCKAWSTVTYLPCSQCNQAWADIAVRENWGQGGRVIGVKINRHMRYALFTILIYFKVEFN